MKFLKLIILSQGIFMSISIEVKGQSILPTLKPPRGLGFELPPPPSVITSAAKASSGEQSLHSAHSGIEVEEPASFEEENNRRIRAIDFYRQVTNMGVYEYRWQESLLKTTRLYRFTSE